MWVYFRSNGCRTYPTVVDEGGMDMDGCGGGGGQNGDDNSDEW